MRPLRLTQPSTLPACGCSFGDLELAAREMGVDDEGETLRPNSVRPAACMDDRCCCTLLDLPPPNNTRLALLLSLAAVLLAAQGSTGRYDEICCLMGPRRR